VIEILHKDSGRVILRLERSTLQEAAEAGLLDGVDLRGANLRGWDLFAIDFGQADLRNAELNQASLLGAQLDRANLRGADLSGARAAPGAAGPPPPGATRDAMRPSQRVIRALWDLEKPVVAGVNGVAAGLGAHLAYACDLVIAADDARFIEVFVRRGIALDAGGGFLLPRHVGLHKAKELVFLGDELSAADAERLGLVNKVVPAAELEATCRAWAERLAQGPTFAIGLSKRLLNRSLQADLDALFAEEAFTQALVAQSEDMHEGIRSFMEKRPPAFKGR